MDFSKLQVVAIAVVTTILTNRFLIDKTPAPAQITPTSTPAVIAQTSVTPIPTVNSNNQTEIILRELLNLRKDMSTALNNVNVAPSSAPVPTLNPSLIGGMVKINSPQYKRVDVYANQSASSQVISSIVYDTIYFYKQKISGWYQLDLDGGQLGWVQAQFLKEFP